MKIAHSFARVCSLLAFVAASQVAVLGQTAPANYKFDFSTGPNKPGYTRVAPTAVYSDDTGYGFETGSQAATGDNGNTTTSTQPLFFSVKVPEGNFQVTVTFGDSANATTTSIKAESGRLMAEKVATAAGEVASRTFTVNVRTPKLPPVPANAPGGDVVREDQFDRGNSRDWDDKLNLEIDSPHAALRTIEITPSPYSITVFVAGDSTVTDRDGGGDVSWGQLISRFFKYDVAVSNQAQSGETLKTFANALRLDKILSQMKKGDYLFMQFAHNDEKASWPQSYVEAETTYKAYLRVYIAEARLRGAIPVLVTAMDRGARGTGAPSHAHGGYTDAVRELAKEENVAFIDLYADSMTFYQSAGADAGSILADGTHSTAYGGYEFAKCIITGIRQNKLDLANHIVDDFKDFDPAHPDTAASLDLSKVFPTGGGGARGGRGGRGGRGAAAPGAPAAAPGAPVGSGDPGPGPL